jgi:hypothetical protein
MGVESKAFGNIALSVPESDPVPFEATPGELLAVTHGFFMAWTLAEALLGRGSQADELIVATECTFAGPLDERELVAVDLFVRARVHGLEPDVFAEVVALARRRYLQAAGLREGVAGEVHADLLVSE